MCTLSKDDFQFHRDDNRKTHAKLPTMHLIFLLLALLPFQAQAWTFTPGQICRLTHETPDAKIELTYDPAKPLYSVTISRAAPLPNVEPFTMRFIGAAGRVISTRSHTFNDEKTAVTAQDQGFGNVLDGLQFNNTAEAILGTTTIQFPLDGAAEPTAQFRKCETSAGV